jgi:hypothetical protein
MKLTANNKAAWLSTIWKALDEWQDAHEGRNAAGGETFEARYDDICTAMAWIAEELGVEQEDI